MKTVFKVGQEVFDQVYYPGIKGKVVEIDDDGNFPIRVEFGVFEGSYKLDGRANNFQVPTLSTKLYEMELQGFEQKAPTPTYEEAEEWIRKEYAKGNNYLMKKDSFEALRKLTILREYYNKGWRPNWGDNNNKYCIECEEYSICPINHVCNSRVMAFKTSEIRDKFLKEQRELLEIAKPLL